MHAIGAQARSARVAVSALFTMYGLLMTLWVVHIPAITSAAHVSKPVLGVLVMLRVAGSVVVMQFAGPLADRIGTRRLAWIAATALSLAIAGPALASDAYGLGCALLVFGFATGGVEVAGNTQGVQIERAYGRPIMASVHAFFGCGAILGALAGAGTQALHYDPQFTLTLAGAITLAVVAAAVPRLLPPESHEKAVSNTPWSAPVVALGMMAFAAFFATGAAYDWAALLMRERLRTSDAIAALPFTAYSCALTLARFSIDPLSKRLGRRTLVQAGSLLSAAGLGVATWATAVPLSIAGWTVYALGLAGILPQVASATGTLPGGRATNMARVWGIGFCGMIVGPLVVGTLTRFVPLPAALAAPLVALLCCWWLATARLVRL